MYFDLAFITLSIIILGIIYFLLFRKNSLNSNANNKVQAVARRAPQGNEEDSEEEDKEDNAEVKSKKQLAKEAKKQEKKEKREVSVLKQAIQHQISNREKKDEERRKFAEEKEKKREEEEKKRELEFLQAEEERKKKEEEEYQKWKVSFQLEQSGLDQEEAEKEEKSMISKFVNYIKMRKVVQLDELANEFKISTKELVSRINSLEEAKRISGVIDDRGKYIFIEETEFQVCALKKAIANYIKAKGRVSKFDLLNECNRLVRLNPTESVFSCKKG